MVYVYELYNENGIVEYVGESKNPKLRFHRHINLKRTNGTGKFFGRKDLQQRIVAEYENKKEAFKHQTELQKLYGLDVDMQKARDVQNQKGRKPFSEATLEKMRLAKLGKTYKELGRSETPLKNRKYDEGYKRK
jgi:hypothetical protein